ncbi:hypothetical protein SCHPADRAFT_936155 [Schizopora paradoxa]|uniref:Uncharacterized protein n=1 Tax=Schizopora paradoxa TaxID=27342 RepID=A0A0H2S3B5_9AGAM|nr:hypothetical protein SCHPADRAFT_936155 [Schizopora paradoxa]
MPDHSAPTSKSSSDSLPSSTSILNKLRDDDVTYSYWSKWSSNYTVSNLVGVGRVLGNLYSKLGSSLERRLGNYAIRAYSRKQQALVLQVCEFELLLNNDESSLLEEAFATLLVSSRSKDTIAQMKTFETVVQIFVQNPSALRNGFRTLFETRKEISELVTFSWKRPGVEYRIEWLYWYKLASRCLSSSPNSVIESAMQIDATKTRSLDFSHFEDILRNCSDIIDSLLALLLIDHYWDYYGIKPYIRNMGFHNVALLNFVIGLVAHREISYFHTAPVQFRTLSAYVILQILVAAQKSESFLLRDGTLPALWVRIFELHHFLRSSRINDKERIWVEAEYPSVPKPWKDLCCELLSTPEQASLCENLVSLHNTHGITMRERFPSQNGSFVASEERD